MEVLQSVIFFFFAKCLNKIRKQIKVYILDNKDAFSLSTNSRNADLICITTFLN